MELNLEGVRGLTELDRAKFVKDITVPCAEVENKSAGKCMSVFKKYLLKFDKLRPVVDGKEDHRRVLLDPTKFSGFEKLSDDDKKQLEEAGLSPASFAETTVRLHYENFRAEDVFKAVLPEGKEGCTSFSRIGHIVHLNLREHLLPYKLLIGQVLVDKMSGIRTVVNKSSVIDSTYRNFQMEVLAGEQDFIAQVKENTCTFKFDFSQVYWNPRLCTEHERIVKLLPQGAVLFDVFAGVGPFSVPAAKVRKCRVFANDLNPHSFRWLNENVRLNKAQNIDTFNMDGRSFIRQSLRAFLMTQPNRPVHVTMNLPALAVEFLDAFVGLLSGYEGVEAPDVTAHVYSFCEETSAIAEMRAKVELALKCTLRDEHIVELIDVRDVSPKKHMLRLTFRPPFDVLTRTDHPPPESKRIKLDSVNPSINH
uniref:tRNA (guanine(37)-N1)-methyltransferase n=1 Tax=Moina brachiata TaxID=675436 RepID=A0A4Y7NIP7_9CRUS|nr:EOG090X08TI [Moina brachiata]SVE93100.1 EOG090X08TI [Moina brachiata]